MFERHAPKAFCPTQGRRSETCVRRFAISLAAQTAEVDSGSPWRRIGARLKLPGHRRPAPLAALHMTGRAVRDPGPTGRLARAPPEGGGGIEGISDRQRRPRSPKWAQAGPARLQRRVLPPGGRRPTQRCGGGSPAALRHGAWCLACPSPRGQPCCVAHLLRCLDPRIAELGFRRLSSLQQVVAGRARQGLPIQTATERPLAVPSSEPLSNAGPLSDAGDEDARRRAVVQGHRHPRRHPARIP